MTFEFADDDDEDDKANDASGVAHDEQTDYDYDATASQYGVKNARRLLKGNRIEYEL
jgi:hypothetical protein